MISEEKQVGKRSLETGSYGMKLSKYHNIGRYYCITPIFGLVGSPETEETGIVPGTFWNYGVNGIGNVTCCVTDLKITLQVGCGGKGGDLHAIVETIATIGSRYFLNKYAVLNVSFLIGKFQCKNDGLVGAKSVAIDTFKAELRTGGISIFVAGQQSN